MNPRTATDRRGGRDALRGEDRKITDDDLQARIAKLPAWARDHIARLARERDSAVRLWKNFNQQTSEGPFWAESIDPEKGRVQRVYLDAMSVHCKVGNIEVEIHPGRALLNRPSNGVAVTFRHDHGVGHCAIMPQASNAIEIVETKE